VRLRVQRFRVSGVGLMVYHAGALPEVLLHELGADHLDEGAVARGRHRARHHRLPCAWGPVQQHPPRRVDPDLRFPNLYYSQAWS